MAGKRVLILGGTTQALAAAERLNATKGIEVITSMAGVTRHPRRPEGSLRQGGFGGAEGLARYLRDETIAAVLDATHPYAAQISRHAAAAGEEAGVPVLHLARPPWEARMSDQWHEVANARDAAAWLNTSSLADGATVFLTIGRTDLAAFAETPRLTYLSRSIEAPDPSAATVISHVILARGPFSREDELRLLTENQIACVVAKNSGGTASYPKIEAARDLGIPVVMITRPNPPTGTRAATAEDAIAWVSAKLVS
jgi:precorrin-6A/cobalt-precorrin-6A reductase